MDLTGAGLMFASVVELAGCQLVMIISAALYLYGMRFNESSMRVPCHSFKCFLVLPFPFSVYLQRKYSCLASSQIRQ